MLGPAEEPDEHLIPAEDFYAIVSRHAQACGVTRLADVTGLDRLSLPVWQAVRPAGKALSVHQGKAATAIGAKIGALCEAIESDCAENAPADGPCCSFDALPARERAEQIADFSRTRESAPAADAPVQWSRAADAHTGGTFYLPHALVSLDLTPLAGSLFDRSSAGLGVGSDVDSAMTVSLLELIERDAVGEWQRRPMIERLANQIRPDTIGYSWLRHWQTRFAELGVDFAAFGVSAAISVPVIVCWIGATEDYGGRYRSFAGSACHPDPERALFKALAEAIQSRLTFIAGVRDDILPSHYSAPESVAPPKCDAGRGLDWAEIDPGPSGWQALADRLARTGYERIAVKRLDRGMEGLAVTKMFVPGLGSLKRARRRAG